MSGGRSGLLERLALLSEGRAIPVAALAALVAGLATMTPDLIGVFFDDAIYALLGRSIAEGNGYVYGHLPGTPPAIHYPPLFPALLALVWRIEPAMPAAVIPLKLVNPVMLALAAAGATRVMHHLFGFREATSLALALLGFVGIPTLVLANVLLSEPMFLALLFPMLLSAARATETGDVRDAAVAGLWSGALLLTRTVGGVFVVSAGLVFLTQRRWRSLALYSAVVLSCALPWQMFVWRHATDFPDLLRGSYGPYLEWMVGGYREGGVGLLHSVLAKNFSDALRSLGAMLTPGLPGAPRLAASLIAVLALAFGLCAALRQRRTRAPALGVAVYLVVVFAWPFQIERFLWGLWPLLVALAAFGVRASMQWLEARQWFPLRAVVLGSAMSLAAGHLLYNVRGIKRGWASSASRQMSSRAEPVVRYLNADPRLDGKVVASEADPVVALYTGLRVVPLEVLEPRDHIKPKDVESRAAGIAAFDAAYRPDAFVLMADGVHVPALLRAPLDAGRLLVDISPPGLPVRAFLVTQP